MKKTLEVETYSMQDLEKLGYKERQDGSAIYLGNSKWPTHLILGNHMQHIGKTYKLRGLDDSKVLVESLDGNDYWLPLNLIKTKIKKVKTQKTIFRDEVIKYHGYGFEFPCNCRKMGEEEAVHLAKWILKVVNDPSNK